MKFSKPLPVIRYCLYRSCGCAARYKSVLLAVVLAWASLISPKLLATRVVDIDLYTVEATVADRSRAARAVAAKRALEEVYARVTGSAQATQEFPALQSSLRRASDFVQSYQYVERDSDNDTDLLRAILTEPPNEALQVKGNSDLGDLLAPNTFNGELVLEQPEPLTLEQEKTLRLVLRFADYEVLRVLEQAYAPRWQSKRPAVLLEIRDYALARTAVESQNRLKAIESWVQLRAQQRGVDFSVSVESLGSVFLGNGNDEQAQAAGVDAETAHGLTREKQPDSAGVAVGAEEWMSANFSGSADLSTSTGLSTSTDFSMSANAVNYNWVLQLTLTESREGYLSSWQLLEQDGAQQAPKTRYLDESWQSEGSVELLPDILTRAVSKVSDELAKRYAVGKLPFGQADTDIIIRNVRDSEDYLALEWLFRQSAVFDDLQLLEANEQYLLYRLPTGTDSQKIRSLLELTGQLKVLDETIQRLEFHWVSKDSDELNVINE